MQPRVSAPKRSDLQKKTLFNNLLSFCRLLRRVQLDVTTGKILDLHRSLRYLDLSNKTDFYNACKINLTSSKHEIDIFDQFFAQFWRRLDTSPEEAGCAPENFERQPEENIFPPDQQTDKEVEEPQPAQDERQSSAPSDASETTPEYQVLENEAAESTREDELSDQLSQVQAMSYSPDEVLLRKDFSDFQEEETREFRRAIALLAPKIATRLSRRRHAFAKGRLINLRTTIRKNLRYGGDIIELARARRRIKKNRIVLFCDVSGSMDCYSKFLIQFIHSMQNEVSGVETVVFSTRMTRITGLLKRKGVMEALSEIAIHVHDWSGGTNIGNSLATLNSRYAGTMLNNKTIVIIISDGWDRGDTQVLEREIKRLRRRIAKLIWLNPLLGSPDYKPICKGMTAALPHCDYFLPAHNLESLMVLSKTLKPLVLTGAA